MGQLLKQIIKLYDKVKSVWISSWAERWVSNILVLSFILGIFYYASIQAGWLLPANDFFTHPFFAIEISFTLLLIFELFSLIFSLPRSVARSNSKQYEVLSLIFLRSGFKEFSHIDNLSDWSINSEPVIHMFAYGAGGLVIYALTNITYSFQKHTKITVNKAEQLSFIAVKKLLALILLLSFFIIGISDTVHFIKTGTYSQSFESFYTILIFCDILIVLIALRYSTAYNVIFRYSAFVLATIFIRISFSLDVLESIAVGVSGAVFVLLLTLGYNYFSKESLDYKNNNL
ncbi:hypothetical protein [Gillisia sp. Hel_I_29]|uniref:hypothetical protein n=1 Tax=Gillisia sp. Hel_I_29 TaxID=1249975 RepID=UPI000554BFC5|nr:hypothetical protein [Gillisia sp. Hel_I_29]